MIIFANERNGELVVTPNQDADYQLSLSRTGKFEMNFKKPVPNVGYVFENITPNSRLWLKGKALINEKFKQNSKKESGISHAFSIDT